MKTRSIALAIATTAVIGGGYLVRASTATAGSSGDDAAPVPAKRPRAVIPGRPARALLLDRRVRGRGEDDADGHRPDLPEPDVPPAGTTDRRCADLPGGRAAADQAVSLAPADRTARTLAAGIHYTTHDFAAAEQAARTLVRERPTDAGPLAVLGDAELELGDYAGATTTYGRLAASSPDAVAVVRAPGAASLHPGPHGRRRPAGQRGRGAGRRLGVRRHRPRLLLRVRGPARSRPWPVRRRRRTVRAGAPGGARLPHRGRRGWPGRAPRRAAPRTRSSSTSRPCRWWCPSPTTSPTWATSTT